MRVRCDRCGNKALIAASQCPHCGHLLDLRDGFGELLPLEHCTTCDTHYPARQGACHWCGTKPEGFRIGPYAWKGAGVLACIGLGWGAWAASRSSDDARVVASANGESTVTTVVDSGEASRRRGRIAVADTALDSLLAAVADVDSEPPLEGHGADTIGMQPPVYESTVPPIPISDSTPIVSPGAGVAIRGPAPSPAASARVTTAPAKTSPSPRATVRSARAGRWVKVQDWVMVRAAASRSSRIIASIGPDTRVQVGEARGDWIRVRMKGINGWVERSRF